jgi:outer membrane protein W
VLAVVLFISAGSYAAEVQKHYIKVASLKQKSSILDVKWKLDALGYPMVYERNGGWYRVYAGPFKELGRATKALKRIQKRIAPKAHMAGKQQSEVKAVAAPVTTAPVKAVAVPPKPKAVKPVVAAPVQPEPQPVPVKEDTIVSEVKPQETVTVSRSSKRIIIPVGVTQPKADENEKAQKRARKSSETKAEGTSDSMQDSETYDFYIAATAGLTSFSTNQVNTRGTLVLNKQPDERSEIYGVELGYYFNDSIFSSFNYNKADLDDTEFDHLYLTLNYRFRTYDFIRPYVGVIAGYSKMQWQESLINSTNNKLDGYEFFNGAQVGVDIVDAGPLTFFFLYRYFFTKYETSFTTFAADAVLTHDDEQSFNFGLRYSF